MATANMETSTPEAATAGHIVEGPKSEYRQPGRHNGLEYDNDSAFIDDSLRLNNATSGIFCCDDEDGANSYAGDEDVSSDNGTEMEIEERGEEDDGDDESSYRASKAGRPWTSTCPRRQTR
jgi:hypothetical protein